MDNLFSWILVILLNVDFLFGIPDLNSFLPFEMEEDLLLALGYRLHGRQQGRHNHWFNNFGSNTNMHDIFHPRSSINIHDTFHQGQSVFDQWLKGKITTNRNNEMTFTPETTTEKPLQNFHEMSKKDLLNTKTREIIYNHKDSASNDRSRQYIKPKVDFDMNNVGSLFGIGVSHNTGASEVISPLQNTRHISSHSMKNINVNNIGLDSVYVNTGTSSISNSSNSVNSDSQATNNTISHSKSISGDFSSSAKQLSHAASVVSNGDLISKDISSSQTQLFDTLSGTSNAGSISKGVSSDQNLLANKAIMTTNADTISKDNLSSNTWLDNTASGTSNADSISKENLSSNTWLDNTASRTSNADSISKDFLSSNTWLDNTAGVTSNADSISKDNLSSNTWLDSTASVTSNADSISKDDLSRNAWLDNTASVTSNADSISKDNLSRNTWLDNTASVTSNADSISKDILSHKKRESNTASVSNNDKSIFKDSSSRKFMVANTGSMTSNAESVLKDSSASKRHIANTRVTKNNGELISKDISSVTNWAANTGGVTYNAEPISKHAKNLVSNTRSITSNNKLSSKDVSFDRNQVTNTEIVSSNIESISKGLSGPQTSHSYKENVMNLESISNDFSSADKTRKANIGNVFSNVISISSAKNKADNLESVSGKVRSISKDIIAFKKRIPNIARKTSYNLESISKGISTAKIAAVGTSNFELFSKDTTSTKRRTRNSTRMTISVANPINNIHIDETVLNSPLTVRQENNHDVTTAVSTPAIIPFKLGTTASTETPTRSPNSNLESIIGFRNDLKHVFKNGVTASADEGIYDLQISKITKEYKPATVEFRPLTEIYRTVTVGFNRKLDSNNSDKKYTFITTEDRGKKVNIQNDPEARSFLLPGRNFKWFDKNMNTFITRPTTLWPFFNGVTTKPRDISFKSSVVIPLEQSFATRPVSLKQTTTMTPAGIPIRLPFMKSDFAAVSPLKVQLPPQNVKLPQKTAAFIREEVNIPLTSTSALGACNGCKMENGAGYNSHPTDCDKYVQCYFDKDNIVTAYYRSCPWGQFWNQEILSCHSPQNAKCKNDPCYVSRVGSYREESSCRSYWTCQSQYSVPKCCPRGHRYQPGVGCVSDSSCYADCQLKIEDLNTGCDKRGIRNRPAAFEQYVEGHGWVHMECASGTKFDTSECSCSLRAQRTGIPDKCNSLMHLEFSKSTDDISGNDVFVQNENVDIRNGHAHFNGSSRLVIPQFTNAEFGKSFGLRIRFKEEKGIPRHMVRQSIINNGDCGKLGSVRLTLDASNVVFGIETDGDEEAVSFNIRKPLVDWTEVVYYFSDNTLDGWVNGESNSRFAAGTIEKRKCALQIGHGEGFNNFIGQIDEVQLFRCDTGALDQQTSTISHKGKTLPSPLLTTRPQIFSTTPKPNPTGSVGGVFITMPTEIITPPPRTTGGHFNNGFLLTKPTHKYTHTKTTVLFTPEVRTLPPIVPRSLPPIIVPVTFPDITAPKVTGGIIRPDPTRAMPPTQPVTFVQTTPPYIPTVYTGTMPPIIPAGTTQDTGYSVKQGYSETMPPWKQQTHFSWADLQTTTTQAPAQKMPSRSSTSRLEQTTRYYSDLSTKSHTSIPRVTTESGLITQSPISTSTTQERTTTKARPKTTTMSTTVQTLTDNRLPIMTTTQPSVFSSTTSDVSKTTRAPPKTTIMSTTLPTTTNKEFANVITTQPSVFTSTTSDVSTTTKGPPKTTIMSTTLLTTTDKEFTTVTSTQPPIFTQTTSDVSTTTRAPPKTTIMSTTLPITTDHSLLTMTSTPSQTFTSSTTSTTTTSSSRTTMSTPLPITSTTDQGLFTMPNTQPPTYTSTTPDVRKSSTTTTNVIPQSTSTQSTTLSTIDGDAKIPLTAGTTRPPTTVTSNEISTITPILRITSAAATSEQTTRKNTATEWASSTTADKITTVSPSFTTETTLTTNLPSSTSEKTTKTMSTTREKETPTSLPSTVQNIQTTVLPTRRNAPDPAR